MDHRQQPVVDAGARVARVQQSLDAAVGAEVARSRRARRRAMSRRWKSSRTCVRGRVERRRERAAADAAQRGARACAASGTCSVTVHALHRRSRIGGIHRLERVVPVAVAVGRELRARDHARARSRASARSTCCQIVACSACASPSAWKNGTDSSRIAASSRREQVLGEREHAARTRCRRASRPAGCCARARRT